MSRIRTGIVLASAALFGCAVCPGVMSEAGAQVRPIIMIDPGHGGDDHGVVAGELIEKDLILEVAFSIAAEFVRSGFDVRFTRTGDYGVEWDDRRARAEAEGAALLVMLHLNLDESGERHGAEVYAYMEDDRSAAAAASVGAALERAGSAVVVAARPWPFLQSSTVPTVMIELAFMTHPVERRLLLSPAFQRELGAALVGGTRDFLGGGGR